MEREYIAKLDTLPEHGLQPGSFLTAVLSNDLMGALARADHINRNALPAYGTYLYNYVPSQCHGSPEKFAAWRGLLADAVEAA